MTVTFVACAKSKLSRRAPARELYTSALFQKARRYAEARGPWYVLSALHGVLPPDKVVAPYDVTLARMGKAEREQWSARCRAQLAGLGLSGDHCVVLAGERYREGIVEELRRRFPRVDVPMEGLRVGEQLQWLTEQTSGEANVPAAKRSLLGALPGREAQRRFLEWFAASGPPLVPLFDTEDEGRVVRTRQRGKSARRLLCRHPLMEEQVIRVVEAGLARRGFEGVRYFMGTGSARHFLPRYIGIARAAGRVAAVSANLSNIRSNKSKFARWGDGSDYHIGDLSQALFQWRSYRGEAAKYDDWATALFSDRETATLRQQVLFGMRAWHRGDRGPSGRAVSLDELETELIELARLAFSELLLNRAGANGVRG